MQKLDDTSPLISVAIVTYNSGEYIEETLESVKSQTYKNLELIVSDDCSKDNTIELVKNWFGVNGERFVRTTIIESSDNTGIAANCNRAVNNCRGDWLKMLGGDDLLLPDCIEKNVSFVEKNSEVEVVFSDVQKFKVENGEKVILGQYFTKDHELLFSLDYLEQLKMLLKTNLLPAPSCFIRTSLLKKYRYDEAYFCLEDFPMWMTLLQNGIRFYAFTDTTVMYRIGDSSMRGKDVYFKRPYFESYIRYFWNVKIKLCRKYNAQDAYNITRKNILQMDLADVLLNNKRTRVNDILFFCIRIFVRFGPKFKL